VVDDVADGKNMDDAAAAAVNVALEIGILAPPDEKKALGLAAVAAAAAVVDDVIVLFGNVNGDTPVVVVVSFVVVNVEESCGSTLHSKGAVEKSGGPGECVTVVDDDADAVVEVLDDD
jgi:hypothetical protein